MSDFGENLRRGAMAIVIAASLLPAAGSAQETEAEARNEDADDVLVVRAQRRVDPALAAFLDGDYEKAEIEFALNAKCALRAERNLQAVIDSNRVDSNRAESTPSSNEGASQGGGAAQNSTGGGSSTPATNLTRGSRPQESSKTRTCEDRGYQLYMKGLSQIQLGKTKEAKETLYSAVAIQKTLWDAHFRLALLEYQDGNMKKAEAQLRELKRVQRRCKKNCDVGDEIAANVAYLEKLFENA